ncbi:MAG: type II toxin-antitoxin system RelE/ParE family toxin [Novosphingobium sp.]
MRELIWRESALEDLDSIITYIGRRDFAAAQRLQSLLQAFAERLTKHPFMYRSGRLPGTREALAHRNYLLVYRVTDEQIEIVNVMHSRRQYPPAE